MIISAAAHECKMVSKKVGIGEKGQPYRLPNRPLAGELYLDCNGYLQVVLAFSH